MPTPTLTLGLQQLIFPDIGHDPGTTLRDRLKDMFEFISDNIIARRSSVALLTNVSDTFDFVHNLDISPLSEIRFEVFSVDDARFLTSAERDARFTFTDTSQTEVQVERIASGLGPTFYFFAAYYKLAPPLPSNIEPELLNAGGSGVTGTSDKYSREDHKHALNIQTFAASTEPGAVSSLTSGAVGTGTAYARDDHSHDLSISAFASSVEPGSVSSTTSGTAGVSNNYARQDHSHDLSIAVFASAVEPPSVSSGTSGAVGVSGNYAREDHNHDLSISAFAAGVEPGAVSSGTSGAAGVSTNYARQDHSHDLSISAFASGVEPPSVSSGSSGAVGASTNYARQDHSHDLGTHTHADANTGGALSGTYNINITGNAATATNATNATNAGTFGNWTPSATFGGNTATNISAANGRYFKIGRMVFFNGTLNINTKGFAGSFRITGLPFTVGAGMPPGSCVMSGSSISINGQAIIRGFIDVGTNQVGFFATPINANASGGSQISDVHVANGTSCTFFGFYETDS